jgi:plasmid stabilization system protein ParE
VPGSKDWHYSDQALADLIAAAQHLDEESDSSGAGDRLIEATAEACDQIAMFPYSGRLREDVKPGARGVPLTRFPFLIIYRIKTDGVEISRILHTRRDLKKALRRKRK